MQKYLGFQIHITDKCTQRCKHCYLWSDNQPHTDEMTFEQFQILIEQIKELCKDINKLPSIGLTGGDPLCHPDFWKFAELIRQNRMYLHILGNPFFLTDAVCQDLYINGCRNYQLSLDGLQATHDYFRKQGSFETTLKMIPLLKEYGINVTIMSTISSRNIDEIIDLIDIIAEHKPTKFVFARYCPIKEQDKKDYYISPQRYKEFLEKVAHKVQFLRSNDVQFVFKDHLWELYRYEKLGFIDSQNMQFSGCGLGWKHLTILPNCDVYACRRMESKLGSFLDSPLINLWKCQKMHDYRKIYTMDCGKCELVNICRGCPSVAYGYTGDWKSKDPQCWKELANE